MSLYLNNPEELGTMTGYAKMYDFLYLPRDFKARAWQCMGTCFLQKYGFLSRCDISCLDTEIDGDA